MHRRAIITNIKFAYKDQKRLLRGKLKYFEHRNDKTGASHVQQYDAHGQKMERWVDRGLGDSYQSIFANSQDWATDTLKRDVGARLLVVAPEVHWMQAIPETDRVDILRELTEATVENWFERMNLPTAEYAFVVHESEPSDARPDGRLKDETQLSNSYLHTHVVLAATVAGLEHEREGYRIYDRQIHQLHEAGREAMEQIWTRELGVEKVVELTQELEDRTQKYLALDAEREQLVLQSEMPSLESAPLAEPTFKMPTPVEYEQDFGLELE